MLHISFSNIFIAKWKWIAVVVDLTEKYFIWKLLKNENSINSLYMHWYLPKQWVFLFLSLQRFFHGYEILMLCCRQTSGNKMQHLASKSTKVNKKEMNAFAQIVALFLNYMHIALFILVRCQFTILKKLRMKQMVVF